MPELNDEFLYGPAVAAKLKTYREGLPAIQEKYQDFFDATPPPFHVEGDVKSSKLEDFIILQYDAHRAAIGFDGGLPTHIAEETRQMFLQAFAD